MKRIKIAAVTLTLCLAFTSWAFGQAHEKFEGWCSSLETASSPDLVQFLNSVVPNEENARCVTWTIHKLGKEHYEPAITPLVRFLDFRRPQTEVDRAFHGLSEEMFPAKDALALIGKKALPELLRTIEAATSSDTLRQNAVKVWMEIYRQSDENPKGVADLKQEEMRVKDESVKARLKWALEKALTHCNPPEWPDCQQAAKRGAP